MQNKIVLIIVAVVVLMAIAKLVLGNQINLIFG